MGLSDFVNRERVGTIEGEWMMFKIYLMKLIRVHCISPEGV